MCINICAQVSFAKVDPLLRGLKQGEVVQLERKGFFRIDRAYSAEEKMVLVAIPDGRAK